MYWVGTVPYAENAHACRRLQSGLGAEVQTAAVLGSRRVTAPRESFHWIQSVKRTMCVTDRLHSRFRPYLSAGEDCSVMNARFHGTLNIKTRGGPGVETEAALWILVLHRKSKLGRDLFLRLL